MQIIAQAPAAANLTISSGAATAAFSVIAGEPGAGTQLNLNLLGSNRLNGQPFTVRASGTIAVAAGTYTTAATPIQIVLNAANTASFAAASGNAIYSSTALVAYTWASAVAGSIDWQVEAHLVGTSASGRVGGFGFASIADANGKPTNTTSAATGTSLSAVNFSAEPPLQFTVGIISAAANLLASPVASLTSFVLEA